MQRDGVLDYITTLLSSPDETYCRYKLPARDHRGNSAIQVLSRYRWDVSWLRRNGWCWLWDLVPTDASQTGLIGDAVGFGLVSLGIGDFLAVVCLPVLEDRGDGEESTVWTNPATLLRLLDCFLEQQQGQSKTPFLVFTKPPRHILQVLDHSDNRVKRGHIAGFQQIEQ